MKNALSFLFVTAAATAALAGCATPTDAEAPDSADDGLEAAQLVTNVNADGTWTADALAPTMWDDTETGTGMGYGRATFTGPTGKTRKMGACLLRSYGSTACTSVANCGSAPATLPTGGARYCTAPGGSGTKYCYYRPGTAANWCAGSPANGGTAVSPGTFTTPTQGVPYGVNFISYGCFEGCTASDPSSSSVAKAKMNMYCIRYPEQCGF